MLTVTKSSNGLVLLDEPDIHLSPKWKYQLKKIIEDLLDDLKSTQILINTHDPLLINGSKMENIRIIYKNGYITYAEQPTSDAIGKSIDGLLHSQYFGLETTLDDNTKEKMKKREDIYRKYMDMLDSTERDNSTFMAIREELNKLNKEIGQLPFSTACYSDKLYEEYLSILKELSMDIDLNGLDQQELNRRQQIIKKSMMKVIE